MAAVIDRPPPHNLDAERGLLGSLLLDPGAIELARDTVQGDDFYHDQHRKIYDAILRVVQAGSPPDFITVTDELRCRDQHEPAAAIAELMVGVPTAYHLPHYTRIVRELAQRRRMIGAAGDIVQAAYDTETDTTVVLDQVLGRLDGLARQHLATSGFVPIGQALTNHAALLEQYARMRQDGQAIGVRTGYPRIDEAGVFMAGDLVLLAAEPGMGKTALLLNILRGLGEAGRGVVLAEFEMSETDIVGRIIAAVARIWATKLRTGELSDDDLRRIVKARADAGEWPVWFLDGPVLSVSQLRRMVVSHQRRHAIELLLVDYLQLMVPAGGRHDTEARMIGEMSRQLKTLALDAKLVVIAVVSLNRAGEGRRAALDRLRGSGQLGFDADTVLFIEPDKDRADEEGAPLVVRRIEIVKARHGQGRMTQWVAFDRPHQRITPVASVDEFERMRNAARTNGYKA